jgi:4-hydroxy-tetrahydrodipicolinate reductase
MNSTVKITLIGGRGRMGRTLEACAPAAGCEVVASLDKGDDLAAGIRAADVVIDFSLAEVTGAVIDLCIAAGKPLVIGTTGHGTAERAALRQKAAAIPCVWTGNYSVGVNLLFHLVRTAAAVLPPEYHAEVVEAHHSLKKDAPSGTAVQLVEQILQGRDWDESAVVYGREGLPGERPVREVGVHAVRMGDVVGEHTVFFAAAGERLELTHRATDRAIFARGALRAARWLGAGRQAGVYGMADVLGLKV